VVVVREGDGVLRCPFSNSTSRSRAGNLTTRSPHEYRSNVHLNPSSSFSPTSSPSSSPSSYALPTTSFSSDADGVLSAVKLPRVLVRLVIELRTNADEEDQADPRVDPEAASVLLEPEPEPERDPEPEREPGPPSAIEEAPTDSVLESAIDPAADLASNDMVGFSYSFMIYVSDGRSNRKPREERGRRVDAMRLGGFATLSRSFDLKRELRGGRYSPPTAVPGGLTTDLVAGRSKCVFKSICPKRVLATGRP
jgi:hypothetical protein